MDNLQSIKEESLRNNIPIILDDSLEIIKQILLDKNPEKILEIGTATGYSAISFSNILFNNVKIDTIEIDEKRAKEAIENIKKVNLENNINVIIGDAVEILQTINIKYDFIFIDASKGKYPIFLKEAIRLSQKGSIIVADNILYKGYVLSDYNKHKQRTSVRNLREYLAEVNNNPKLETKIIEVGDGLAVSKVIK